MYNQPQHHRAHHSHEIIAGAVAFMAMRKYEQRECTLESSLKFRRNFALRTLTSCTDEAANGRPANHHLAKEIIAGLVAAELDHLIETKGMDYIDRQRAHQMAVQHCHDAYDQNHGYGY